jgi:hypothetical protein
MIILINMPENNDINISYKVVISENGDGSLVFEDKKTKIAKNLYVTLGSMGADDFFSYAPIETLEKFLQDLTSWERTEEQESIIIAGLKNMRLNFPWGTYRTTYEKRVLDGDYVEQPYGEILKDVANNMLIPLEKRKSQFINSARPHSAKRIGETLGQFIREIDKAIATTGYSRSNIEQENHHTPAESRDISAASFNKKYRPIYIELRRMWYSHHDIVA